MSSFIIHARQLAAAPHEKLLMLDNLLQLLMRSYLLGEVVVGLL